MHARLVLLLVLAFPAAAANHNLLGAGAPGVVTATRNPELVPPGGVILQGRYSLTSSPVNCARGSLAPIVSLEHGASLGAAWGLGKGWELAFALPFQVQQLEPTACGGGVVAPRVATGLNDPELRLRTGILKQGRHPFTLALEVGLSIPVAARVFPDEEEPAITEFFGDELGALYVAP